MIKTKSLFVLLIVSLLITGLVLVGCSQQQPADTDKGKSEEPAEKSTGPVSLRAAAGGVGGGWYTTLAGVAEIIAEKDPNISVQVVPGGGLLNPPRVGTHEIDMAFVFPPFMATAREGVKPFDKPYPDLRGVVKGFGLAVGQFIVAEDTGITSIKEIFEKKYPLKVAVDRVGTTDEWLLRKIFEYYDVDYETIKSWGGDVQHAGYGDQAVLIKDRHVDALFGNISVPWTAAMEAGIARKIRVLPFPEDLQKYLIEKYSFSESEIPAGTYGVVDKPLRTVASITTLCAHKDVPEDVIYRITKIICENVDRVRSVHDAAKVFDPKNAWDNLGAPLHPGAEKYYKEAGYIK